MILAPVIAAVQAALVAQDIGPVFLTEAAANGHKGARWSLVLPDPAKDVADGSLVARTKDVDAGTATHRRRLYQSTALLSIAIVQPTVAEAETAKATLLRELGRRVLDAQGNSIRISRASAKWTESAAVTVASAQVTFGLELEGGIYQDTVRPIALAITVTPAGLLE